MLRKVVFWIYNSWTWTDLDSIQYGGMISQMNGFLRNRTKPDADTYDLKTENLFFKYAFKRKLAFIARNMCICVKTFEI